MDQVYNNFLISAQQQLPQKLLRQAKLRQFFFSKIQFLGEEKIFVLSNLCELLCWVQLQI